MLGDAGAHVGVDSCPRRVSYRTGFLPVMIRIGSAATEADSVTTSAIANPIAVGARSFRARTDIPVSPTH